MLNFTNRRLFKHKFMEIFERTNRIRYYIKPDETIQLADNVIISTSNQWNPDNIKTFIEQAKRENYNIEVE